MPIGRGRTAGVGRWLPAAAGAVVIAVGAGGAQAAAGAFDPGFGSGGTVLSDLGGSVDAGYAVAVQKDGKIVAAGFSNGGGSYDFALVRYQK